MKKDLTPDCILKLFRTLLFIGIITFATLQVNAQMSVTATAGTTGPTTYATLKLAFDAINAGTHQGVISISVLGNTTETAPAVLNQSTLPSSYTSVTIKPAVSVTATITSAITTNGPVYLYGASNVTIDGSNTVGGTTRDLTIKNTSSGYIVRIGTPSALVPCKNITLKNCTLTGGSASNGAAIISDGGGTVGSAGLVPTNHITIQNNSMGNIARAFQTNGPALNDSNLIFRDNAIATCRTSGVVVKNTVNPIINNNVVNGPNIGIQITNGQNVTIDSNSVTSFVIGSTSTTVSSGGTLALVGIEVVNGQTVDISRNTVTGPVVSIGGSGTYSPASGIVAGICISTGQTVSINNNIVTGPTNLTVNNIPTTGIQLSSSVADANVYDNQVSAVNNNGIWGAFGFYVSSTAASANINAYNNFIADIASGVGSSVAQIGQGIYMDQGNGVNFYHNSIDMSVNQPGAIASGPASAGICLNPTGTINAIKLADNIVANSQTTGNPFAIYSLSPSSAFTTIDYNDYYAPTGNLGYIGSSSYNTILGMQTGFGGNINSIIFSPTWLSTTDLHLVATIVNAPLNAGTFITTPSITTDIDGNTRYTPTIGADELNLCSLPAITGTPTLCVGTTTSLSDATAGGTWSSSSTTVATVDPSGVVHGVAAGTATISYTTTCSVIRVVTVGTLPITGATSLCTGSTSALSDATAGGTWSSDNSAVATVDASGVVHATTAGTANISYTFGSCPPVGVAVTVATLASITGTTSTCVGATTALTDATAGGVWSSTNSSVATVSPGGVVYGASAGTTNISYTFGSCSTGVSVIVGTLPIMGATTICTGSSSALTDGTTGGTWSSDNSVVATVTSTGVVYGASSGTANISYTFGSCPPVGVAVTITTLSPITGPTTVCTGSTASLSDVTTGGFWSSSNSAVATVSGGGVVYGTTAGTVVISYSLGSCVATTTVSVGSLPAITGTASVCVGSSTALSDATTGGIWSSDNTVVATVSAIGVVYGVSAGTANISYTVGSCTVGILVTVNSLPSITGPTTVCVGATIALSDATTGGTWSSGSPGAATISATGVVTGVASGSSTIYYTLGACSTSILVTVGSAVPAISGPAIVCVGATITLSDALPGGIWSSDNTPVATVAAGVVGGVSTGTANISYTVGGCSATIAITVLPSSAGVITGKDSVCKGAGHEITLSDNVSGGVWSSTNTSRATVDPVTGVVTGTYASTTVVTDTIKYTVTNSCGTFVAKRVIYIRTIAQCATGVNLIAEGATELKVFPNPNGGIFAVNLLSDIDEEVHIVITNVVGEKITEMVTTTNRAVDIKLSPAAGIYLLSASTGHGRYMTKIVVN